MKGYKATTWEDSLKITTREAFLLLRAFRILLDQQPCKFLERNRNIGKGTLIFPKTLASQEGRGGTSWLHTYPIPSPFNFLREEMA